MPACLAPGTRHGVPFFVVILLAGTSPVLAQTAAGDTVPPGSGGRAERAAPRDPEATFHQVMRLLMERHADDTLTREALYEAAIQGMLEYASVDLPGQERDLPSAHSLLLLSPERQEAFAEFDRGRFEGIGCLLGPDPETGSIVILEVMEGSPAREAGLKVGDRVLSINGVRLVAGTWPQSAVPKAMGESGPRRLVIQRGDEERRFTIAKASVALADAEGELLPDRTGLVRVRHVGRETPATIHGLLTELEKRQAKAIIIDLRDCVGSNLEAAVQILDMLVAPGKEVLRLADRNGHIETFVTRGEDICQVPCVVLVNTRTGLAGEVIARAMKRYRRTPLIGTPTRGRSLVAENLPLDNGYAARIPVRRVVPFVGETWASLALEPGVVAGGSWEDILRAYQAPDFATRLRLDPGFEAALEVLQDAGLE